jgi:hypothetical protein
MAGTASIPEDRPLTTHEAALVRWILEHGTAPAASFLPQLAEARVVSRCYCGCASVDFSIGGVVPPPGDGIGILADFEYRTAEGHLCGAFVFERAGLLAGLEVWSVDGLSTPSTLPAIEQVQQLGNVQQVEPSAPPTGTVPGPSV